MNAKRLALTLTIALLGIGPSALGWGELGHQVIGRVAARLTSEADPKNSQWWFRNRLQLGHLSNIPDIHWKNLDRSKTGVRLLGDSSHFFDSERVFSEVTQAALTQSKLPLEYEAAKLWAKGQGRDAGFFQETGTLPWRARQFAELLAAALVEYPADCRHADDKTLRITTYAGLLSHFIGDAAQPYHSTVDFDGAASGNRGIHSYFESELVDALEFGLEAKVLAEARKKKIPRTLEPKGFGEEVAALSLTLLFDSHTHLPAITAQDKQTALLAQGRRPAKDAAPAFEAVIVDRLATGAAVLAEIWRLALVNAQQPKLCPTWHYALAPEFISPADPTCFGYALSEKDLPKRSPQSCFPPRSRKVKKS